MIEDKYNLLSRPKEELIAIIEKLTEQLSEKDRLEFISKWIDPRAALLEAGEGDGCAFLEKVDAFCGKCLAGDYYTEETEDPYDYRDYYDGNEVSGFRHSEWAEGFSSFFRLAVMYSRNHNYDVSYRAFERLTGCLREAESDEALLGTDHPMYYIRTDREEVFDEYLLSLKDQLPDKKQAARKAVGLWIYFGGENTGILLNRFDDLADMEEAVRINIAGHTDSRSVQHSLYELLKSFYSKLSIEFDGIAVSESLIRFNPNFSDDLAQGYMDRGMPDKAIPIIRDALKEITDAKVVSALNTKLVSCYESLNMYGEAYETAAEMFTADNTHERYLQARRIACRLGTSEGFPDKMAEYVLSGKRNDSAAALLRIWSYEGEISKLIDTALRSDGYSRHENLKYTAKSLVYRALHSEKTLPSGLTEILQSVEENKTEGIADMIRKCEDAENRRFLLSSAAEMYKLMVRFHIDAAQRSRYARAAYYCAVIREICILLNEKDAFRAYYADILAQNRRRPALQDEMNKKIK